MLGHSLVFPSDFVDYEWEVEAKGYFPGSRLTVDDKTYCLSFYDPVRLGQEIESELQSSRMFFEPNLVVVGSVTRSAMEQAAKELVESGRVVSLTPEVAL